MGVVWFLAGAAVGVVGLLILANWSNLIALTRDVWARIRSTRL